MGRRKILSAKHETDEETRTCGKIVGPIGCIEHIVDFGYGADALGEGIFASYEWIEHEKRIVAIGYVLVFDYEIVGIVGDRIIVID